MKYIPNYRAVLKCTGQVQWKRLYTHKPAGGTIINCPSVNIFWGTAAVLCPWLNALQETVKQINSHDSVVKMVSFAYNGVYIHVQQVGRHPRAVMITWSAGGEERGSGAAEVWGRGGWGRLQGWGGEESWVRGDSGLLGPSWGNQRERVWTWLHSGCATHTNHRSPRPQRGCGLGLKRWGFLSVLSNPELITGLLL